jgi:protein-S-isoprenylcysteine O-methyltransferase Ste14
MALSRPLVTRSGLRRAFVDLSLAVLSVAFAHAQLRQFAETRRPSCLLIVATELLFAVFFVVRKEADAASTSAWDWLTTVGGAFGPLLMRPTGAPHDLLVAQALQVFGGVGSLLGILFLNRSVGVIPAHRRVKSGGAYRLVRHPLYAAYAITYLGYVLSNLGPWNVGVLVVGTAFQVARVYNEERFLSRYQEYRTYMLRTRWRLVPFVF